MGRFELYLFLLILRSKILPINSPLSCDGIIVLVCNILVIRETRRRSVHIHVRNFQAIWRIDWKTSQRLGILVERVITLNGRNDNDSQ